MFSADFISQQRIQYLLQKINKIDNGTAYLALIHINVTTYVETIDRYKIPGKHEFPHLFVQEI